MLPVDFEGTNVTFTKPPNMADDQCSDVRAFKGTDNDGFPFILLAFQPNYEDIQAIKAGRPVMLKIVTAGPMPPVAMYTYDKNFNPNE